MQAYITNIQHFSVGDGDGIRTTVFFAGCSLRCPWCHNPETVYGKGEPADIDAIVDKCMQDYDFYRESGGGVTLSGGECLLQADAVAELSQKLKAHGVSVLIDTAGFVPFENIQRVDPFVDGYLFDFKTWSEDNFSSICGGKLETVLSNLKSVMHKARIRIPLIPDFNADDSEKMCKKLKELGITSVDLIPFHRLGSSKYTQFGIDYKYKDTPPITDSKLNDIKSIYSKYFKVTIE